MRKFKTFAVIAMMAAMMAGCGTATNSDVPANGVTEAPSVTEQAEPTVEPTKEVEPTAEPTVTVAPTEAPVVEPTVEPTEASVVEPTEAPEPTVEPTEAPEVTPEVEPTVEPEPTVAPEPTATPEPTPEPTEAPKTTEAPAVSKADWKDFEVTLGGYTVKLRETTLGELLDTGLITIEDKEGTLAKELGYEYETYVTPLEDGFNNFYVANYEAGTVKSPADCVIMTLKQTSPSDDATLMLGICGVSVGDSASKSSLEAVFGKCDNVKNLNGDGSLMTYSWYVDNIDMDMNCGHVRFNVEDGKITALYVRGRYY